MVDANRTSLDVSLAALEGRLTGAGAPFELCSGPGGSPRYASGPQSLIDLYRRARRTGDKPLFTRGYDRRSYSEIFEPAFDLASRLHGHGWAGHRIALFLDDGAEWLIWFVAITASGASCVLMPPGALDESVARYCSLAECAAIVVRSSSAMDELGIPNLHDTPPPPADVAVPEIAPECEAVVTFTSGSSGTPKGVVHSHRSLTAGVRNMMLGGALANHMLPPAATTVERPQAPSTLVLSPFGYIGGYSAFLLCIATGGRIVLPADSAEETLLATVEAEGLQTLSGASSDLVRRLIRHPGAASALRSLRRLQLHGSALQRSLADELHRVLPAVRLFTGYGASETSGSIAMTSVTQVIDTAGGCGRLLPSVELRVVDEADIVLAPGACGHLQVRGDMLMSGYLDKAATTQVMTPDGWLRTGDLGFIDNEGWLEVTGRSSDRVLGRAGLAAPIEDAVRSACGVEDAAVESSADGAALVLYLQAASKQLVDQARAVEALKSISGWTGVVDVRRLEAFPRTASGKIDRPRLGA